MNNLTARAVQGAVQFIFYTVLVLAFFLLPSALVAVTFGATA
ncbi:hypothetical protein PY310_05345 [Pseudarthrobacter sp. H3Y2-7]|nr:hypothetical protein [Pseudarthrobacter sp. H3Y2-7]MDE8668008.1 hypothetical protein [Pseudarthrobacter sp. H3Y2-7]